MDQPRSRAPAAYRVIIMSPHPGRPTHRRLETPGAAGGGASRLRVEPLGDGGMALEDPIADVR
ncbi:MAG: hypothetical protein ACRD2G_13540, partial [Terriglobia bacterium]